MTAPTPPQVAVVDGHLNCAHQGSRALTGLGSPGTLTVGTRAVVRIAAVPAAGTYDGCIVKDTNGNPQLCNSTTITGAARLTVGGDPVLLTDATVSVVNPLPPSSAPGTVDAGQTRLTAS
jgi:hypothetical protein